jgi:hypothetical protein
MKKNIFIIHYSPRVNIAGTKARSRAIMLATIISE